MSWEDLVVGGGVVYCLYVLGGGGGMEVVLRRGVLSGVGKL